MSRKNFYENHMSDDYERLMGLLDSGNVVVCFVNYLYRTGSKEIMYRDVAKVHANDYRPMSMSYGYVVEARGIVYGSWDRNMQKLRGRTFADECTRLGLEFIDL